MPENTQPVKVHYIHRLSAAVRERIAGIFVLSAVLIIVGLILIQIQSSHLFDDRIHYDTFLTNAQGISTKTLIHISGIEVGQVTAIDITDNNRIHVNFFVYENFQRLLRSDSTGELSKLSVIGNAAIIIKAGDYQLPILPAGSTIPIDEPVSIDELISTVTPVITSLNEIVENVSAILEAIEPDEIRSLRADVSAITSNLHDISEQIVNGKGLIGKIIYDEELMKSVTEPVQQIGPIVKDIGPIVKNVGQVVKEIEHDMALIENILRETELRVKEVSQVIQPATTLVDKTNELASDLQTTSQIVGREIEQLPDMVNKMQNLLDTTNRTIKNAQQVWPLSTVIPPGSNETLIKDQILDD